MYIITMYYGGHELQTSFYIFFCMCFSYDLNKSPS